MVDLRFFRFYVAYKKTGVAECRSCAHRYTINLIAVVVDEWKTVKSLRAFSANHWGGVPFFRSVFFVLFVTILAESGHYPIVHY